ncbi:hypothetical protein AMJ86_10230 [bacterium SM23_57]|nr:MAG: hypothetical protein AMJ86_10230 [bacterium SM23_57]
MPLTPPQTLEILFPKIIWRGPSNDNAIYLTFDDGPHPDTTPRVLDILSDHDIHASFFLLGSCIPNKESIVEQTLNEGHLIANHGFSHKKLGMSSPRSIIKEILDTENLLIENGWSYHKLFRPPFGHFRPGMRKIVGKIGYRLVMWSIMPGDYRPIEPDRLLHRTLSVLKPGSIIVLHDHSISPEPMLTVLPKLLKEIDNRGLKCERLDEIKGMEIRRGEG